VISTKYEDDDEFRRYVQRYLDHFEKLLSASCICCWRAWWGGSTRPFRRTDAPVRRAVPQSLLDSPPPNMAKPLLCMR
jgi:hypothetical protein